MQLKTTFHKSKQKKKKTPTQNLKYITCTYMCPKSSYVMLFSLFCRELFANTLATLGYLCCVCLSAQGRPLVATENQLM